MPGVQPTFIFIKSEEKKLPLKINRLGMTAASTSTFRFFVEVQCRLSQLYKCDILQEEMSIISTGTFIHDGLSH